ncbi:MAG: lamin tail domain-containing protein [Candidatus Buchananbacteria bacterium]
MRRTFFIFEFAILLCCGFFIFSAFANADTNQEFIIPINNGNIASTTDQSWLYTDCQQGSISGNSYIIIKPSSSVAISPSINLKDYVSATLSFDLRTYGSGTSSEIAIFSSQDSGESWQLLQSILPSTASLSSSTPISLDDFLNQNFILKFQTQSTSGKSVGIDNIALTGIKISTINLPPQADAGNDQEGAVGEEIFFNAQNSTDTDGFIADYNWNFGDGIFGSGVTTTHSFATSGEYFVKLTATDDKGASSTDNIKISIFENNETSTEPTSTPEYNPINGDVVINEFLSSPDDGQKEWVELFNNTSSTVDLSGWTISDNVSPITINGEIETKNYFVIEFNSGKLNNSGDAIYLKNSSGDIIDNLSYGDLSGSQLPAPDKNNSLALKTDGDRSSSFFETITTTKQSKNIITAKPIIIRTSGGGSIIKTEAKATTTTTTTEEQSSQTSSTGKIIINEILPRPEINEKEAEYIELKNIGTTTVDLVGWIISDKSGKKFVFPTSTRSILPNEFFVLYRASSSIALNNSGTETVNLYYPNGTLTDSVKFLGPADKNFSWSRNKKDEFFWTSELTPDEENIFSEIENDDRAETKKTTTKTTATVKKIKTPVASKAPAFSFVPIEETGSLPIGQKIITRGIVSVPPGILGSQIFYLNGIQIYCNKKDFPNLAPGDLVEINGEISQASGEKRIKITGKDNIKIISHDNALEIKTLSASEISDELIGSLVKIKGTVLDIKGSYIYIDDGESEAKIYIKASTGINIKDLNLKEGDVVEIVGIVSISPTGLRILPRAITDITKQGEVKGEFETAKIQKSQPADKKYFWAVIIFMGAVITFLSFAFFKKNKA